MCSWEHHHLPTAGCSEMILRRECAQPLVRAELGRSQAQPAIFVLQLRDFLVQRRKAITFLRHLQPYHQRRESDDRDKRAQNRRDDLRRPPGWFHAWAHRELRSIHRTFALRARGLREVSDDDGLITLREIAAWPPAATNSRKRSLTGRSSSE